MALSLFFLTGFLLSTLGFFRFYRLPAFKSPAPSRKGDYRVYPPKSHYKRVNKTRLLLAYAE